MGGGENGRPSSAASVRKAGGCMPSRASRRSDHADGSSPRAPPRGPPMGLLVFPFGVKRYEDHVMPIGSVPMPHHALGAHSGIFLPSVGVLEDSGS